MLSPAIEFCLLASKQVTTEEAPVPYGNFEIQFYCFLMPARHSRVLLAK